MIKTTSFIGGFALGAGLMYLLDPDAGGRRRALMRDQAIRLANRSGDFLGKAGRDLQHRTQGLAAETWNRIRGGETSDVVLVERVRSKMGRYVSHPHAVKVTSSDGCVTLRGPILADEAAPLLDRVATLPGVLGVHDELEKHASAEGIPALQGGSEPPGEPSEWEQEVWTPALQLVTAVTTAVALFYGTKFVRGRGNGRPIEETFDEFDMPLEIGSLR